MVWSQFYKAKVCPSLFLKTKQRSLGMTRRGWLSVSTLLKGCLLSFHTPKLQESQGGPPTPKLPFILPLLYPFPSHPKQLTEMELEACEGEQRRGLKSTAIKEREDSRSKENESWPRRMRGPAFSVLTFSRGHTSRQGRRHRSVRF